MESDGKQRCMLDGDSIPHGAKLCAEQGQCGVCLDGEWLKIVDPYYYMKPCGGAK
jgi:hypothetical protein